MRKGEIILALCIDNACLLTTSKRNTENYWRLGQVRHVIEAAREARAEGPQVQVLCGIQSKLTVGLAYLVRPSVKSWKGAGAQHSGIIRALA